MKIVVEAVHLRVGGVQVGFPGRVVQVENTSEGLIFRLQKDVDSRWLRLHCFKRGAPHLKSGQIALVTQLTDLIRKLEEHFISGGNIFFKLMDKGGHETGLPHGRGANYRNNDWP